MIIRLNNKDLLQLTRAIKGGCIDTDKVACLKKLVDNYNPPEQISDDDLDLYLKCLLIGWRLVPITMSEWRNLVLNELEKGSRNREMIIEIGIDVYYKQLIKTSFTGLVVLGCLGYHCDFSELPDIGKMTRLLGKYLKIEI